MEYEAVKEWLDQLVANRNELHNLQFFNNKIEVCGVHDSIQIYQGIEILADAMGVKLNMQRNHEEVYPYPYRYYFNYCGYEIVQVCVEPLEGV